MACFGSQSSDQIFYDDRREWTWATVSTLSDLERQRNRATTERRKDFLLREEAFLPYREMLPILIEPNGDKDFQEMNFAVTSGDAFVAKSLAEKLANEQQKAVVLIDVQGKHNGGVSSEDKEAMMRISFSGLDVRGSQRRRHGQKLILSGFTFHHLRIH